MMDRKRRFDYEGDRQSAIVPSVEEFSDSLKGLNASLELASLLDVYCVYVSFLRDGYSVNVEVNHGQYYSLHLNKSDAESEIVIPITFSYANFTVQLLTELIGDRGQISLAWVADDGSFTMHKAVHDIIPPKEKFKDSAE